MKMVHWTLMGGLLHLVQRGRHWAGRSPPRPLLAVPNDDLEWPLTSIGCSYDRYFVQEADLSQTDCYRAMLRVIEYFAKSFKVTQGHSKW